MEDNRRLDRKIMKECLEMVDRKEFEGEERRESGMFREENCETGGGKNGAN